MAADTNPHQRKQQRRDQDEMTPVTVSVAGEPGVGEAEGGEVMGFFDGLK